VSDVSKGRPTEGQGTCTPAETRWTLVGLVAIYAVAWVGRFLYVLHLRKSPLSDHPMLDELYHVEWAQALAGGDWIGGEVFFRAPLYPYTLGLFYKIFGGSLFAARTAQVFYGALLPVALYFLGRRVFGKKIAIVSAAVAAVYPFFIYFTNELLIVTLIVLLDTVLLLAVLRADETPSWGRWLVAGLVAGASAIARPSVLIFIPFLLVWIWLGAAKDFRRTTDPCHRVRIARTNTAFGTAVLRFGIVLLGMALLIAPVTARNYIIGKDFVPIASQGGVNFFIGNNEESDGASAVVPELGESWRNEDAARIAEFGRGCALKPSEISDYWYERGRRFITTQPGRAAKLFLKKFVYFWDSFELANNKDVYHFGKMSWVFRITSWLHFGLVGPLGLLGMWMFGRRRRVPTLLSIFVISYMVGVVLFFVNARFRLPVIPMLILFAVAAAFWIVERVKRRDVKALVWPLVALVTLGLFVNYDFYETHRGEHPQTYFTIGLAKASQGKYEEAIEEYERAIELSPGFARAYNNMGLALERLGREEEAIEAYETALKKDPELASAANNIGIHHWAKGDHETAARWFALAVEIDPYMAMAHYNLGGMLVQSAQWDLAEAHFKSAVIADRQFEEAWNALGLLFEETDRPAEAIAAYTRAVMAAPTFSEARNNLGIVLAKTGQYDEALRELEMARQCAPDDPKIQANIRQVRELMRRSGSSRSESPGRAPTEQDSSPPGP
jgi:tetratricopeptide (TPR) repeat protein